MPDYSGGPNVTGIIGILYAAGYAFVISHDTLPIAAGACANLIDAAITAATPREKGWKGRNLP